MKKSGKTKKIRFALLKIQLTAEGRKTLEDLRVAAKKATGDEVVFTAIRRLGKRHGIRVPKYKDADMFALVRGGLAPIENVRPMRMPKWMPANADVIIPIVGEAIWRYDLIRVLGASSFKQVVRQAMHDYHKELWEKQEASRKK
ncbi:hypothetical protein H7X87_04055 [Acetobacteraceae bacterium]|nr:hypothetical protein [Candidatus Parcubacteria bacterium]